MTIPHLCAIPTSELVYCADCRVAFSSRRRDCPKCAAIIGIFPVEASEPSKEIGRLRDNETWITAELLQIAHGTHDAAAKARMAARLLEFLKTSNAEANREQIPITHKESVS